MLFGLKVSNILTLSLCIMYMETACGSVQNRLLNDQIVNPVKFFVDRESESNKVLYTYLWHCFIIAEKSSKFIYVIILPI